MVKVYEFQWKGNNQFQQKQKGKCLGQSKEEVEKRLQHKGYSQLKIQRNFAFAQSPKQEQVTQLLNQLSLLINAKIPLKQALVMLCENCYQIKLYQWLKQIIQSLENGFSFSLSIEQTKHYLSTQELQLIRISEKSGRLGMILTNIVDSRIKSEKLMKKVKKILFYPMVILIIALIVSLFLLMTIVPNFAELYSDKQQNLPFITEALFSLSNFLQENVALLIILAFAWGLFLSVLAKKTSLVLKARFYILSKLPVFKDIIHHSRTIFFCQNSSLMLQANLRLDTILNSFLNNKANDPFLSTQVTQSLMLLQKGYPFYQGLTSQTFNNEIIQMIEIGEKSGNLAQMLEQISDIYQQKLDYQIDLLSQLLEPMLMLIMGLIVGTIIVGLYLPIFDMGNLVQ